MMIVDDTNIPLEALLLVQRGLLKLGYRYVLADECAWPFTNVAMEKDGRLLLLALMPPTDPARLREVIRELREEHRDTGLLVLGTAPVTDETEAALFTDLVDVPLAYLDLQERRYRLQAEAEAPDALTPEVLAWLIEPDTAAQVAEIDCRRTLHVHLRQQAPPAPWLTYAIIAACVAMFGVSLYRGGMDGLMQMRGEVVLGLGALSAVYVYAGEWWRLLTAGFLHGSAFHLFMNMMALFYFGAPLEGWQGRWRLGGLFLFSVLTSSVISLFLLPTALSVGASGGLFGLLGGMVALLWRYRRVLDSDLRKGLYDWLKSIIPINLVISFVPGINWAGHFGGFLGGLIIIRPPFRTTPLATWERAALAFLLLLTAAFSMYVIGRIPAVLLTASG